VTAQDPVVEQALAGAFAAAGRVEGMRGLAVARDGELLAQRYYNGSGPYVVHDVRSVTKSVVSILIGIAIDRGLIESVDQTLADYLGGVVDSLDAAKGSITIRNLLTMSAGHRWQGLGSVHEWGDWMNAPDQITYVLEKPLVDAPGTRFNYSDGSAHLLSVILTEATGMRAVDFAAEHLFEPLGIGPRFWLTDNRGYSLGAAGIRLTPLDMLAIGALYLDGGVARGQRVVSEEWVSLRILSRDGIRRTVHSQRSRSAPHRRRDLRLEVPHLGGQPALVRRHPPHRDRRDTCDGRITRWELRPLSLPPA
jgi:CubicO group peptidase (beta-lactamase class C family)